MTKFVENVEKSDCETLAKSLAAAGFECHLIMCSDSKYSPSHLFLAVYVNYLRCDVSKLLILCVGWDIVVEREENKIILFFQVRPPACDAEYIPDNRAMRWAVRGY